MRYDLLVLGLRLEWLGTDELTWLDLLAVVRQAPEGSAVYRVTAGQDEDAPWGLTEMLLGSAVDALNMANWLQSSDGSKGINRPEPIPRPGLRPVKEEYDPLPVGEMLEWLGWDAPGNAAELTGPIN